MALAELRSPSGKLVAKYEVRCGDTIVQVLRGRRLCEINVTATMRLGRPIVSETWVAKAKGDEAATGDGAAKPPEPV